MKNSLSTTWIVALAILILAPVAQAQIEVNGVNTGSSDFEAVVDAAAPGDSIYVPDGTYIITGTAQVGSPNVTVQGQSEAGTIIQVNLASNGWGLATNQDNTTIRDMTFESISTAAEVGFIIKGNPGPGPTVVNGITIERVTVFGDQTSTPKRRAGIDVNGFDNVVINDVDSRDASWGNGIQISGCHNVQINNPSTSNNAWGSIGIFCTDDLGSGNNRGSDNVTITGTTNVGPDTAANLPIIYIEDEFGVVNTNVTVTGWDYLVRNTAFRADAAEFTFVKETEADAIAYAQGFVDDTLTSVPEFSTIERISDGHFVVAPTMSIQLAVDAAPVAGTVEVGAGSYTEQVEIAKDLTLQGAGIASTTIVAPTDGLTDFFTTSADNYPVVYVHDASDVTVRDLTVDGNEQGNLNNRFYGIAYRNAGGTVTQVRTVRTRHTLNDPLGTPGDPSDDTVSGVQGGNGIYAYNNDGVTRTLNITNNVVEDFQKNGITVNSLDGTATEVNITGNTVTGSGVLTADFGEPAQNGIQVYGSLITGSIDGNNISGIAYDNTNASTKWVATTILDFFSGADITNNVIPSSQVAVYKYSAYGAISNNDIAVDRVGVRSWGIIATDPPRAVPQPDVEPDAKATGLAKATTLTVVVDGNDVTFSDPGNNAGTFGIEADAGFTPDDLDVTITNNVVTGFEAGVDIYQSTSDTGVFTNVAVNQNDLAGNDIGVRSNVDYLTVDATCNWYGDVNGPLAPVNPVTTGSAVEGDVTFSPWLDAPSGNCITSTENLTVGPPPSELNDCTNCVNVPVSISRTDATAARGVSVTFQLSPELELCGTSTVSTGAGTFYDGFTNLQAFQVDNGGGSYTFDTAVLGSPCGPTGSGEVFFIPVTFAGTPTTDTTGTITITSITFRDCNNAPLPLYGGSSTTIDIDVTAPGAVTDLVATQVKSGNDSNSTTKIDLTWTLPADTDLTGVRLFRKGFGDYPEYDDLSGAVPTTPADPSSALIDGWTEVTATPLAPTATSYTDEPATRDFWYYVAFVEDECYVSAVSGQTAGTLNYHLGDIVPTGGNNLVFTGDISALGTAYGTFDGDATYNANADVGPTTDFSVDARPTTDDQIQFEDLIVFAINYNSVGKLAPVDVAVANALSLVEPQALAVGEEIRVPVTLAGDGSLQGLSVAVDWNDDVLEYVGWTAGDIATQQNRPTPVFSPAPGVIDAAVMGVRDVGLAGDGTLAHLRFRVKAEGPADLRFETVDARDVENEKVTLDGTVVQSAPNTPAVVSRSVLRANVPNPFNPSTKVRFALAAEGRVNVRIYDVSGRLVRTLVSGVRSAGEHEIVWDGTDDGGRTVSSGTYLLRMQAPDRTESRRMMLVK